MATYHRGVKNRHIERQGVLKIFTRCESSRNYIILLQTANIIPLNNIEFGKFCHIKGQGVLKIFTRCESSRNYRCSSTNSQYNLPLNNIEFGKFCRGKYDHCNSRITNTYWTLLDQITS